MMRRLCAVLRPASALLIALFMGTAASAGAPLVLGSYAYPAFDREQALAPLAALVGTKTGQPVEIRLYKDPEEIAAKLADGEVDVAVLNLGAWLRVASAPDVVPLAMLTPASEVQERYRAVLLARSLIALTSLQQIIDHKPSLRLVAVLPGSTSGGLVQLAALADAGSQLSPWRSITYAGSHEAAIAALADGDADLAAVAEVPWLAWRTAQAQPEGALREIWRSPPLPSGPVVCRQSERVDCRALATALVSDDPAAGQAAQSLAQGWPELAGAERFSAYDAERYAGLIAAGTP